MIIFPYICAFFMRKNESIPRFNIVFFPLPFRMWATGEQQGIVATQFLWNRMGAF